MISKEYNKNDWIKEPVNKIAEKISDILVNTGQNDHEKFYFCDNIIKYTPTEVEKIIKDNWDKFIVGFENTINVTSEQLPKTRAYLVKMERIFQHICADFDSYDNYSEEEKFIFENPMLVLAGIFNSEAPEWAEELAKYICVMKNINSLDVKVNVNKE